MAAMTAIGAIAVQTRSGPVCGRRRREGASAGASQRDRLLSSGPGGSRGRAKPTVLAAVSLWSDGAVKTRWVFLPAGHDDRCSRRSRRGNFPSAHASGRNSVSTAARSRRGCLWRAHQRDGWRSSYVWNESQTDAVLAPDARCARRRRADGQPPAQHTVVGSDCLACHGAKRTEPLGFNPLQLSTDRDPNAIHGEPMPPGAVTLRDAHRGAARVANEATLTRAAATDQQHERGDPKRAGVPVGQLRKLPSRRRRDCRRRVPSMRYSELIARRRCRGAEPRGPEHAVADSRRAEKARVC